MQAFSKKIRLSKFGSTLIISYSKFNSFKIFAKNMLTIPEAAPISIKFNTNF